MAPSDAMPKARDAAKRALAIDARLAEAHTILGLVHLFYDWDRAAAEAELQRAIRLDPGYVLAHRSMAALQLTGRRANAAIEHSQEAVRLDPVSVAEHYFLGLCYREAGEFDAAERTARKMLELEPSNGSAITLIATLWERQGEHAKAVEMYLQAAKAGGASAADMSRLSKAYHAGGILAFRDAELQSLGKTWDGWHFSAYLIAVKQASAGHRREAYSWLRRARDARSAGIVLSNSEFEFERYRNDPAFRQILGPAFTEGR
jgi:tetratricopeptide (TPR) repeat protein